MKADGKFSGGNEAAGRAGIWGGGMIRDDAWGRWMEQQKSWGFLHFENIATDIQTKKAKNLPYGGRIIHISYICIAIKNVYLQICCSS